MRQAFRPIAALATLGLVFIAPALAQTSSPLVQDGAISEMQRPVPDTVLPAVPRQNAAGAAADAMDDGLSGTRTWLKQAQDATRRGNLGGANEFLERAETRMLSRSTLASRAGEPMANARLSHITAGRAALMRRDRAEALRQIDLALTEG